jgi:colanic acid/amylovoran biosynthesis glycosyltransferase
VSTPAPALRVGYLVNRYPAVSHTFIRREIAGVVASGIEVKRYSIRATDPSEIVDEADRGELALTAVLLQGGVAALLGALILAALRRPFRFLRALSQAWTIGGRSDRGRLRHLAYLAEACVLRRWLARDAVTHLHAHFGTNPAMVAYLCRLLGGPPYSFTVHGPEEFDRPEALALREKIGHAEFVVAISDFGRSQLMRWTRTASWPKLHGVRCGVDAEFLDGVRTPAPEKPRLVCVGRLCEDKGQLLLVEAAGRLSREGISFELVFVGDGGLRPEIEGKIRSLGLEGKIQVRGWMDGAGVRREVIDARALVLPSFAEGLPVVIMEALALGRPVLSTYVAGIPELVQPGVTGWLVPAGSIEALVDSIREVLQAPRERLDALGRAGQEAVKARHDAKKESARLADLFRLGAGSREPR